MLEDFIQVNEIKAKIICFKKPVMSAIEASNLAKCNIERVIKSILFVAGELFILVILRGSKRVDLSKLKKIIKIDSIKIASPDQVFEVTGYNVGEVPPISIYGVKVIADSNLFDNENEIFFTGGGKENCLMKIKSSELKKALNETMDDFLIKKISV